ncbi:UNVERIFIED_CONTAM: hypothetical protein B566_EDAN015873 [Ephemera danica]|nr:hypothetical protein B566_EDAN015873 [Ephemera danica]
MSLQDVKYCTPVMDIKGKKLDRIVTALRAARRAPSPPLSRNGSTSSSEVSTGCRPRASAVRVASGRPQHFSQVLAALAVSLGPLAAGLGKGYSSPAIASLQEIQESNNEFARSRERHEASAPSAPQSHVQRAQEAGLRLAHNVTAASSQSGGGGMASVAFPVSAQQASWVASLSLLGALFGGALAGVALRHGRRRVLLGCAVPFSASWLLTVFATNVEMMFATAFAGGFCCALVLLVYISEIASPEVRGSLSALLKVAGHVGMLASFVLGAWLDWRQLAMVLAVAPLLLLLAALWLPETPSFLLLSGREEEAAQALQWLRGPHADTSSELATLRENIQRTRQQSATRHESWFKNLNLRREMLRPVMITCALMFFQRFSGANAFNFYAVPIFRETLGGGLNPHGSAVVVGIVQLLAALASGLLIDSVGRVPLLAASLALMAASLAGFGTAAYYGGAELATPASAWLQLACVLLFTVAFSLGIAPIPWLLLAELFPLEDRGSGSAIATGFSYACAFIGVKTFVDFQQWLGLYGAFWLYAVISVFGLFFVLIYVPETKGCDLDEMEQKYNNA